MKVGDRVELPAWSDAWMRGARFGEVTRVQKPLVGTSIRPIWVKPDKLPRKRYRFLEIDLTLIAGGGAP